MTIKTALATAALVPTYSAISIFTSSAPPSLITAFGFGTSGTGIGTLGLVIMLVELPRVNEAMLQAFEGEVY